MNLAAFAGLPWGLIGRGGLIVAVAGLSYCKGQSDTHKKRDHAALERQTLLQAAELKALKDAHTLEIKQEVKRATEAEKRAQRLQAAEERAEQAGEREQNTRSRNYALSKSLQALQDAASAAGDICGRASLDPGVQKHFADRLSAIRADRSAASDLSGENQAAVFKDPEPGNPELAGAKKPG